MVKGFFKMPSTDNTMNGQKLVDCPCQRGLTPLSYQIGLVYLKKLKQNSEFCPLAKFGQGMKQAYKMFLKKLRF